MIILKITIFLVLLFILYLNYNNNFKFVLNSKGEAIILSLLLTSVFIGYQIQTSDDLIYFYYIMEDFKSGGIIEFLNYSIKNPLILQNLILFVMAYFGNIHILSTLVTFVYFYLIFIIIDQLKEILNFNDNNYTILLVTFILSYPLIFVITGLRFPLVSLLFFHIIIKEGTEGFSLKIGLFYFSLLFLHLGSIIYLLIRALLSIEDKKIQLICILFAPILLFTLTDVMNMLTLHFSFLKILIDKVYVYITTKNTSNYFVFLYLLYHLMNIHNLIYFYDNKFKNNKNKQKRNFIGKNSLSEIGFLYSLFLFSTYFIQEFSIRFGIISAFIFFIIRINLIKSKKHYFIIIIILLLLLYVQIIPFKVQFI